MKNKTTSSTPPVWGVIAAFAAVYLIWGSTYLGIRYAVETIPPFLMAATRHIAAGSLLFGFAVARGAKMPSRAEWRDASITGVLLLAIGNGGVAWAEQTIPSGVTALLVALVPLWMVLLDWWRPGGVRPRRMVAIGLLVGFLGVGLLARGNGNHSGSAYSWGVAALMVACISWAYGSIFNRQAHKPESPLIGVALQMIAGGVVLLALTSVSGEAARFSLDRVTLLSAGAWLYLTTIGSLIGYTCYIWLLHVSTPARVSTYAYVNPFIAVLLGCTIGREPFSHELLFAGALIIAAVVLIVRGGAKQKSPSSPSEEIG